MGVNPESLAVQPQVAPLFRQNGVTPQKLVEILRCDTAPESQKFVQVWDALTPAKRSCAGLEAMAMGAGISPRRLWEVFCGAALIQGKESVGLVIALALPDAMRVTIKEARKPKGHFAREHLFKAARVLPVPKGSTTNINLGSQKELPESQDMFDNAKDRFDCTFSLRVNLSSSNSLEFMPHPVDRICVFR